MLNGEITQKMIRSNVDTSIVDSPLAHIILDTDDREDHMLDTIRSNRSGYVLLLCEEDEQNRSLAKKLIKAADGQKRFIGYLDNSDTKLKNVQPWVDVYSISSFRMSETYCEEAFESRIYQMGLAVHAHYGRRDTKGLNWEQIRKDFRKDRYNIESSERSALHGIYKLASVGIDPESPDAADQYYNKVLSQENEEQNIWFDRLTALEHRSWTAYMILHGARTVQTAEELMQYAYVGKNDWKDRSDPEHIKHPCIKAAFPGRRLPVDDWENMSKDAVEQLDPLDNWSRIIHCSLTELAKREHMFREHKLRELHSILLEGDGGSSANLQMVWNAYQKLEQVVTSCLNLGEKAQIIWKETLDYFISVCKEESLWGLRSETVLSELDRLMRPAIRVNTYVDFKKLDEDMLFAVPEILQAASGYEMSQKPEQFGAEQSEAEQEIRRLLEQLRSNPLVKEISRKENENGMLEVHFYVNIR